MFFKEYQTDFFGDSETLDFIEMNLSKKADEKYRLEDRLRVATQRPVESAFVDYLRETQYFMIYVTKDERKLGLWSFFNGKEFCVPICNWYNGPVDYKYFVDKENLLMDVKYNLLHGMSYKGLVDIAKLSEVKEDLLIQKSYLVDPAYEYSDLFWGKEFSAEENKYYLDFCKANKNIVENVDPEVPYTLPDLIERRLFNADKERLIKLIGSGDLEILWYWHLTKYEYAALALPEIQHRLKVEDESVFCKLEEMFHLLDLDDVVKYKEWLINSDKFV